MDSMKVRNLEATDGQQSGVLRMNAKKVFVCLITLRLPLCSRNESMQAVFGSKVRIRMLFGV